MERSLCFVTWVSAKICIRRSFDSLVLYIFNYDGLITKDFTISIISLLLLLVLLIGRELYYHPGCNTIPSNVTYYITIITSHILMMIAIYPSPLCYHVKLLFYFCNWHDWSRDVKSCIRPPIPWWEPPLPQHISVSDVIAPFVPGKPSWGL